MDPAPDAHQSPPTVGTHDHHDAAAAMSSSSPFCSGDGTIMYMDGFRFSLGQQNHPNSSLPCLNVWLPFWTLNARWKFLVALVGVVALAVAVEGLARWRLYLVQQHQQRRRLRRPRSIRRTFQSWVTRILIPLVHGVQALLGYLLMLVAMTFSVELFAAVLLGLTLGYSLFFLPPPCNSSQRSNNNNSTADVPQPQHRRSDEDPRDDDDDDNIDNAENDDEWIGLLEQHATANPCCEYMQQ